jgi:hypothetical protein
MVQKRYYSTDRSMMQRSILPLHPTVIFPKKWSGRNGKTFLSWRTNEMYIREFFDLPIDQREELFKIHIKQKDIRNKAEYIKKERHSLNVQEATLQEACEHPFAKSTTRVVEDEYGRRTGTSESQHYCPDCDKKWYSIASS